MHHHIGQRLSFNDYTCTVRFLGQLEGREGEWLGVEWDDDAAGKNNGTYRNLRYFECRSRSPTAGSFIRPSRPCDAPLSFLQALEKKYQSSLESNESVEIGGKTVEEVDFQRLQQQLSDYQNLRAISLSRCRIAVKQSTWAQQSEEIGNLNLKVQNLDLSNNLLESWAGVIAICRNLRQLEVLDLTGNQLLNATAHTDDPEKTDKSSVPINVSQLILNRTFLSWEQIVSVVTSCPRLSVLAVTSNDIRKLTLPLRNNESLTSLDLAYNCISRIDDIAPLASLPHLKSLSLAYNPITGLWPLKRIEKFRGLEKLLLAGTKLSALSSISAIPIIFPNVTDLVTTDTPFAAISGARLLTIGHLASTNNLNRSVVSQHERRDAEIFYLGSIAKELQQADNQNLKAAILRDHPRFDELVDQYGQPSIEGPKERSINPRTLNARVAIITFYIHRTVLRQIQPRRHQGLNGSQQREPDDSLPHEPNSKEAKPQSRNDQPSNNPEQPSGADTTPQTLSSTPTPPSSTIEKSIHIPLTINIYTLKSLVGRLFNLPPPYPTQIRLIYETGEWDPVRKGDKRTGLDGWDEWSSSSSDDSDEEDNDNDGDRDAVKPSERADQHFRWIHGRKSVMREVELPNGTKRIGDWVESRTARIRVEIVGVKPVADQVGDGDAARDVAVSS